MINFGGFFFTTTCILMCGTSVLFSAEINSKNLICGVCKNVEPFMRNTIRNCESLGNSCNDYRVIIYENNSTDQTKNILNNWKKANKRIIVMSEDLSREELLVGSLSHDWTGASSRMENIARARNRVLDVVKGSCFDDFDYVLMVDLDFRNSWPINEIINTIRDNANGDWDCISANGIHGNEYYDRFAFRSMIFPLGPEFEGEDWWYKMVPTRFDGNTLIPVYSAFGGLAIYKRNSVLLSSYTGHTTDDLMLFYQKIMASLSQSNLAVQKYLSQIGINPHATLAPKDIPIHFINNSGYYDYPVCCEHVTFHGSMIVNGFDKMFINPRMILRY